MNKSNISKLTEYLSKLTIPELVELGLEFKSEKLGDKTMIPHVFKTIYGEFSLITNSYRDSEYHNFAKFVAVELANKLSETYITLNKYLQQ